MWIFQEYGVMPAGMRTAYPRAPSLVGSSGDSHSFQRAYTTVKQEDRDEHRMSTEGYSYAVLRTSAASGFLTDAIPPSARPQGIIRQTSTPSLDETEDTSKRYKCEYCGKRFAMPSHYQVRFWVRITEGSSFHMLYGRFICVAIPPRDVRPLAYQSPFDFFDTSV